MENIQEYMNEMRNIMEIRMNQFMETMENMVKGQEELRASIQNPPAVEAPAQNSGGVTNPSQLLTSSHHLL